MIVLHTAHPWLRPRWIREQGLLLQIQDNAKRRTAPGHGQRQGQGQGSVPVGGRHHTSSAASANRATTARRTPNAYTPRSSILSVGLPLPLNAQ